MINRLSVGRSFIFLAGTFLIAFLFCPVTVHAAVLINEVAWMGTAVSANDEWIELYNSGSQSVDLSGWTMSDGASLTIALSGSVGAGAFYLVERTDDDTVPGVSAGTIYTGALGNDGRTLALKRADGSTEDQVQGGLNWESVGGNNTTKDTPQRSGGSWLTATPTPGAQNANVPAPSDPEEGKREADDDAPKAAPSNTNKGVNERISLVQIPRAESVSIGKDRTVHARETVTFVATPQGISPKLASSVTYSWNFGDGGVGQGATTTHVFEYPGQYAVVADAHFSTFDAEARINVTVMPVDITLEINEDGALLLRNDSPREMNISGYKIVDENSSFTFPPKTILLSRGTLTLSPAKLGRSSFSELVFVRGAGGNNIRIQEPIVATTSPASETAEGALQHPSAGEQVTEADSAGTAKLKKNSLDERGTESYDERKEEPLELQAVASESGGVPWYATLGGLFVVIMLGIAGLYVRKPSRPLEQKLQLEDE